MIDGEMVMTGSFNFTKAAKEHNAENLLVIAKAIAEGTDRIGMATSSTRNCTRAGEWTNSPPKLARKRNKAA